MPTDKLSERAKAYVQQKKLFSPGDSLLAALSGGADSVALLYWLVSLKKAWSLTVSAVHVHHGLRGDAADADEAFCRSLCESLSVPLTVYHVDVAAEAKRTHETVETAARRLRYDCLEQEAEKRGASIVTAHTASDQAETVLLHLTRGCGLHGLTGIPPRRGRILRPLLSCTRCQVEEYCRENGLSFVTDETNGDMAYARNRVRHQVMPALKALNPQVEQSVFGMTEQLSEDERYLREQAAIGLDKARVSDTDRWDCASLRQLPRPLQSRALRLAVPSMTDLEQKHVQAMADLLWADGATTLPGGVVARSQRGQLWMESPAEENETALFQQTVKTDTPLTIGGKIYLAKEYDRDYFEKLRKVHNLLFSFCMDRDIIKGDLSVRNRREGDEYRPVGRGRKSLKKLLNESHIPQAERRTLPILTDKDGIVMAVGFGCDERVQVTEATRRVLVFAELSVFESEMER